MKTTERQKRTKMVLFISPLVLMLSLILVSGVSASKRAHEPVYFNNDHVPDSIPSDPGYGEFRTLWHMFAVAPQSACQDACTTIYNELSLLKSERAGFQHDLHSAAPGEKSYLTNQIIKLNKKIATKTAEYKHCEQTHGGKPDLNTIFSGKATMTTSNSNASGPYHKDLKNSKSIKGVFPHWCHNSLRITFFPALVVGPYSTPVGDNTTTVTLVNELSSAVDPANGKVELRVKLHFHHSLAVAGDSNLEITVSTDGQGGTRRQSDGSITLVGDATFQGGYLGGDTCHLIIKGTLQPGP